MSFFTWNDSYTVNHPLIDEHHKKLIKLVDDLFTAMKERRANEAISTVLKELLDYTIYHFDAEQALFEKSSYPKIDGHKKIHRDFIAKVEGWKTDFDSGKSFISVEMLDFLSAWLINHIKNIDKEMATYLTK